MEPIIQLLTLALAFVLLLAFLRRSTKRRPHRGSIKVRDPTVARTALMDHADAFSNHPVPPFPSGRRVTYSIFSAPYGPLWRALRCNLTAGILHPSRLGLLAPLHGEAIEALVAGLLAGAGGEMAVRDHLHSAVFSSVARMCFGDGVDTRDLGAILHELQEFFVSFVGVMASRRSWRSRLLHWRKHRRFAGTRDRLNQLIIPLIVAARRRRPSRRGDGGVRPYVDSLLDLRVPCDDDDDEEHTRRFLSDEEMATLAWEFLSAGTSGAVACIEWTLAHLVAQPAIQKRLHREVAGDQCVSESRIRGMPYLHAVVLESLRLHPPQSFLIRDVREEGVAIAGAAVPAGGTRVYFITGDIGRNSEAWRNPEEFQPERFLAGGEGEGVGLVPGPKEIRMMPFGAGRRYCPGVGLAVMQVKSFVAELVREFEWAPPAEGCGVDFTELGGFFNGMKTPLKARVTPRTPAHGSRAGGRNKK